jgi:ribulose-bisphosphate carboxylase large chain
MAHLERFAVTYRMAATDEASARDMGDAICLEQTVEVPRTVVPAGLIADHIVGQLQSLLPSTPGHFDAGISYPVELVQGDFPNLLNVIFGNSSIKPGLRVMGVDLPQSVLAEYAGPRYGLAGLRHMLGVSSGPLLLAAIKPVGLGVEALADLCYRFALAGMDLIKDDHNLSNQAYAPFEPRVRACVAAVERANALTGRRCGFVPNITGSQAHLLERAQFAQREGAAAVMCAPALMGYDTLRQLSGSASFLLPILSHPAFAGANVVAGEAGFSHGFYFGTLQRLMGVDAVIFPNTGGRFGFSASDCQDIRAKAQGKLGSLRATCPTPGGGMLLDRVAAMQALYGTDVMYLMGGALLGDGRGLSAAVGELRASVGRRSDD